MDELPRIALRVLFAYVLLHQFLRHAGNRAIANGIGKGGEGTGLDFVLAVIIGDLIDDLLWAEVPAAGFVVASGTLVLLHITAGMLRQGSARWWRALEGTPVAVLVDGAPRPAAMRAQRINVSTLAALLRRESVDSGRWAEVRAAYLENSGRLSVLHRLREKPATRADRDRVRQAAS